MAQGSFAHKDIIEFIQQYFADEPNASIDDCCRDAHALRIAVSKDLISGVRRDMRATRQPGLNKPNLILLQPAPKGLFADKPPPAELFKQIKVDPPREEPKLPGEVFVSIDIRRRFYDDLLLSNPTIKINTAMKKVKDKFGRSVDVGYALKALRLIRELNAPAPTPSKPQPEAPKAPMPQPPAAPKVEDSKRLIRWTIAGADQVRGEDTVKESELSSYITKLVSEGIAPNSIEVWKPVPLKLKVQIDF